MFISVFDLFKIGVGPSSSHTMGPMTAAGMFLAELRACGAGEAASLRASLHGSLAFTGKGHGSDRAVILGLAGCLPDSVDPDRLDALEAEVRRTHRLAPDGLPELRFDPERDLVFDYGPPLPGHANGLRFSAHDAAGAPLLTRVYYSIGGGFVVEESELEAVIPEADPSEEKREAGYPFPFGSGEQMIAMSEASGRTLVEMKRANELELHSAEAIDARLDAIWTAMSACLERGLAQEGELPGGLRVRRRAGKIHRALLAEEASAPEAGLLLNEWLSVYAMAVNEENAAGGRVVTAPTNGAAGVIPAVIRWMLEHLPLPDPQQRVRDFLLAASAIGGLIKHNASISGAEVGCQGEVGAASAMAAAGLTAVRGGSTRQIENAAEIALEHHLGMTCDPVAGLVQVPCIERNGLGAVKALTASSLALRGDGTHFVSLDACIETMRQTGLDLSDRYKETAQGGLAVTLAAC